MKTLTETKRRLRIPRKAAPLTAAARELQKQLKEWEASFTDRELREAYIRRISRQIAEAYLPTRIVLFGSHAYGQPTPESDIDLLVVLANEKSPLPQPYQIRQKLNLYAPVDLHLRTVGDVEQRLREGDMFIREITERGKVLYEAQHA
jgi:uncharacterized protein